MSVKVGRLLVKGPGCHQVEITLTGELERSHSEQVKFESFLQEMGVTVEWRDGSGARGYRMMVFLNPEKSETQRQQIQEYKARGC